MDHLVGLTDIAQMLGVTRQRAHRLAELFPDFPAPEAVIGGGIKVWETDKVTKWIERHPERPAGAKRYPTTCRLKGGPGDGMTFQSDWPQRTVYVLTSTRERSVVFEEPPDPRFVPYALTTWDPQAGKAEYRPSTPIATSSKR